MRTLLLIFLLSALNLFPQGNTIRDPAFLAATTAPNSLWTLPVAGYTLWLTPQYPDTMTTNFQGTIQAVGNGTDQSRIWRWKDKTVGSTNDVFSNVSGANDSRPQLTNTAAFKNQPVVFFNGVTPVKCYLVTTQNVTLGLSNSGSYTLFCVAQMGQTAEAFVPSLYMNQGANFLGFRKNNAANQITAFDGVGSAASVTLSTNVAHVYGSRFSNSLNSLQLWTNTALASTFTGDTASTPSGGLVAIGANSLLVSSFWYGWIADVIVYPFELTDQEMTNTLTALKNKYIP